MTLFRCDNCGGQFGGQAETCPQCGAPAVIFKRRSRAALIGLVVNAVVTTLVCLGIWAIVHKLLH